MSARIASAPALPVSQPYSLPPLSRMLVAVALGLARWDARHRTRAALARLDDHLVRDIGLTEAGIAAECAKPFWRD